MIPGLNIGGDKYGWVLPVGGLGLAAIVLNKLGILKWERDATTEVAIDKKKLSHDDTYYKTNADEIYANLNKYVTNAGNVLRVLKAMKTKDDRRALFKAFGKKAATSNLPVLDFNIGKDRDLKQWLLDYHTTSFNNDFVTKYFEAAGL